MDRNAATTVVGTGLLALALAAGGCTHLPWYKHQAAAAPPAAVHELDIAGAAPGSYPQHWQRNTLLVDLSSASGAGSVLLQPVDGNGWPVRLALRVTPGAIGVLEVRGAQRVILPISAGGKPVDLELPPGVYTPTTAQLTVSWGAAVAPQPQSPPTR
jgi:hypothetical protein